MNTPVHHYRGHEILCSREGYTIIRGDEEVLIGAADAAPGLTDRDRIEGMLAQARARIDELIEK